jgi:hypothetical protein
MIFEQAGRWARQFFLLAKNRPDGTCQKTAFYFRATVWVVPVEPIVTTGEGLSGVPGRPA